MCLCLVHYKGEEEENNEDDEEEDAGWMVPHGYLSEGEGCEDDEEVCGSRKNMCDIVHPTKCLILKCVTNLKAKYVR